MTWPAMVGDEQLRWEVSMKWEQSGSGKGPQEVDAEGVGMEAEGKGRQTL